MIQIFPDTGLLQLLLQALPTNLYYFVGSANYTPDENALIGDFGFNGNFSMQTVPSSAFTLQSLAAHVARVTAADITETNGSGSPQDAYTYFATDANSTGSPSGKLILAARFDTPLLAIPPGGTFPVTPTLSLKMGT